MIDDEDFLTNPENFKIGNTHRNFSHGGGGDRGGDRSSSSDNKYLGDGGYSKYLKKIQPDLLESLTFNLGVLAAFLFIVCGFLYYRYHNKKKRIKYQNYLLKSGKFFKYVTKMNDVNKRIKKYKKKESIINSIKKTSNLLPSNSDDMDGFLFF